jgi:pimeloyl-ACP methyl ester carboxylesterase
MPKVKVNDIEMYYEVHGEGTPLLMIMGWSGSSEYWPRTIIKKLSKYHKTILFDNRGTGLTDKPEIGYSINQMTDDAAGILAALKIPKAHVFGISMGGMIAQNFGIRHQDKILGLVIGCAHPGRPHNIPRTEEAAAIMEKMINPPRNMPQQELFRLFTTILVTPEYAEKHAHEIITALKKARPTPGWVMRKQWDGIEEYSSYEGLTSIKVPTLVIHGSRDNWVLPGNAKIISDRIPGSKMIMYEKTGHAFYEEEEVMVSDVLAFLKSVEE